MLFLFALLASCGAVPSSQDYAPTSVVSAVHFKNGSWAVVAGRAAEGIAFAEFTDVVNETGWSFLAVESKIGERNADQAYAAGLAEGYVTQRRIRDAFLVLQRQQYPLPSAVIQFVLDERKWMEEQRRSHPESQYWEHAALTLTQLEGVLDGYNAAAPADEKLQFEDILNLNIYPELGDIADAVNDSQLSSPEGRDHCSALLKLVGPDYDELYFSHVTWSSLVFLLRVYKRYTLPFLVDSTDPSQGTVPGRIGTFSSFPGVISSSDDFYQLSSGLAVLETTIGFVNPALNQYIQPTSVFEGLRVVVANRLARDGEEWSKLFSAFNSGTYNNEWIVLNYGLFTPKSRPLPGAVWLLDQIPGMVHFEDITERFVRQGYWASYNTPYFEDIFNASGWPAMVQKYGPFYSYADAPRAKIFARNQSMVVDLPSMQKLMRYNDFKVDPLSACNCTPPYSASNAIASRSDLNDPNGTYDNPDTHFGMNAGLDAKITSHELFHKNLASVAISGPTYDQQPVFQFSTSPFKPPLYAPGLPDRWDFPWVRVDW